MTLHLVSAIGIVMILFLQHLGPSSAVTSIKREVLVTKPTGKNRRVEARQIWEQAISAKGGRERLYAVRNMVVSSSGKYSHRGTKYPIRQEELIVFPDKYWFWNDLRPDVFGLTVEMYNYETNMHYITSPDNPQSQPKPIIGVKRSAGELFLYTQLLYLLETNWLKPTLVEATAERIEHRSTNVIQTRVLDRRVDFAFDSESHLLTQVRISRRRDNKEVLDDVIDLSDYIEADGIKVPQTIRYDDGMVYKKAFQFNVEYDPEIFLKPSPIEAGPEAWRRKK
jgi:hypothetical protein